MEAPLSSSSTKFPLKLLILTLQIQQTLNEFLCDPCAGTRWSSLYDSYFSIRAARADMVLTSLAQRDALGLALAFGAPSHEGHCRGARTPVFKASALPLEHCCVLTGLRESCGTRRCLCSPQEPRSLRLSRQGLPLLLFT